MTLGHFFYHWGAPASCIWDLQSSYWRLTSYTGLGEVSYPPGCVLSGCGEGRITQLLLHLRERLLGGVVFTCVHLKQLQSFSWPSMLLLELTHFQGAFCLHLPLDFGFRGKTTRRLLNPTSQHCCRSVCPIFTQFWIPELLISQLPEKQSQIKPTEHSVFLSNCRDFILWWSLRQVSNRITIWGTAGKKKINHISGCFLSNLQNKNECPKTK